MKAYAGTYKLYNYEDMETMLFIFLNIIVPDNHTITHAGVNVFKRSKNIVNMNTDPCRELLLMINMFAENK